jgi:hypothetical protein
VPSLPGDIVDEQSASGAAVVGTGDRSELLLTSLETKEESRKKKRLRFAIEIMKMTRIRKAQKSRQKLSIGNMMPKRNRKVEGRKLPYPRSAA